MDDPLSFNFLWPEEIRNKKSLMEQVGVRKELSMRLDLLFREVPNITTNIAEAVAAGLVSLENLSAIYKLLTDFFKADHNHARLILYLPFEILPVSGWKPADNKLARMAVNFCGAYLHGWKKLLMGGNDVRANFVDGDILEKELSDQPPPLVKKAAHLIPVLVSKGLISASEVVTMLHKIPDAVLRESIFDTLPVLADISLFPLVPWRELLFSADKELRHMTLSMVQRLAQEDVLSIEKDGRSKLFDFVLGDGLSVDVWLKGVVLAITEELKTVEIYCDSETERVPEARINWERRSRKEAVINKYAQILAAALATGKLSSEKLFQFVFSKREFPLLLVGVKGVGAAVEILAAKDLDTAKRFREKCNPLFHELWRKDGADVKDTLVSIWARWMDIGIIDPPFLKEFGVEIPKFDSLSLENKAGFVKNEIQKLTLRFGIIEPDSGISRFLYPVVILFGSRPKGYATSESDVDLAVFIKPEVSFGERMRLPGLFSQIFSGIVGVGGRVVEFWLAEEGENLRVQNFATTDVTLADSTWAHILFGGVWCGKKESIQELYKKLLTGYLFSGGEKKAGLDIRAIWLEEMEREVLQYRFMHYGYHRYYVERGGIHTRHASGIDPQSAFWDSGYRRVATLLFLQRVFLPELRTG